MKRPIATNHEKNDLVGTIDASVGGSILARYPKGAFG